MNKRILQNVAEELGIAPSTMNKLDKLGLLKNNQILTVWNNVLYKQGITKRYISSKYQTRKLTQYELAYFTNLGSFANIDDIWLPKLVYMGIVTRYPPSKRKKARMNEWARKVYRYTDNSTNAIKPQIGFSKRYYPYVKEA